MRTQTVAIIGGSGFIGRHVAELLVQDGCQVRIPTRARERAKDRLIVLPTADVIEADVHDDAALAAVLSGCDAVVNAVGILHERRLGGFVRAHAELPGRVIAACRAAGVRRFVHISALAASADAPSEYLRSKAAGEALVRGATDIDWTIFRPSVVFGPDDSFLNLFAQLQALAPVVFLGSPDARFQPVYVEDVARAIVASLDLRATFGATLELGGPEQYTLRELFALVGRITGHARPVFGLGPALSWLQAFALELLPVKLLTRDNVASMKVPNVCEGPFPAVFGFAPTPLEAVAPSWLARRTPRARYSNYRDLAGR